MSYMDKSVVHLSNAFKIAAIFALKNISTALDYSDIDNNIVKDLNIAKKYKRCYLPRNVSIFSECL